MTKITNAALTALCSDHRTCRREGVRKVAELLGLKAVEDDFHENNRLRDYTNFYIPPKNCNVWVMAHHDTCNPMSENANDNSASVVNALLLRMACQDLGVVITDGEEPPHMGAGARRFADRLGETKPTVINLELTGKGGWESVGVSNEGSALSTYFQHHGVKPHSVPFSDSSVLSVMGITSTCLFTCTTNGRLNWKLMENMHSERDTLDTLDTGDMESFRVGLLEHITKLILL